MSTSSRPSVVWPDGKRFAFTIFDDTDLTTMENGPPVYDLLTGLGFRVTKTVWTVAPSALSVTGGATCADPDFLAWVKDLQAAGHELGFHDASCASSRRQETIEALDRFRDLFGHDPRIGADHDSNQEAVYWDAGRLTGCRSAVYGLANRWGRPGRIVPSGQDPTSPWFWADVLRDRIDYWRNFTYTDLNLFETAPAVPYHDAARPYVNRWFAATHAPHLEPFLRAIRPDRLDRLEEQGGACILYTHTGTNFVTDGKVDDRFAEQMAQVAGRPGWFVPASTILDHIRAHRPEEGPIGDDDRARMERRWVRDQLRTRGGSELRRSLDRRRSERARSLMG